MSDGIVRLRIDNEANHPRYGSCDGFGPGGRCSICTGLVERYDGAIITTNTGDVVKKAPLAWRLRAAWDVFRGAALVAAIELRGNR